MAAPCKTVCDGAAIPYLTEELYPALANLVDRTVLVPDEDTLATSRDLLLSQRKSSRNPPARWRPPAPGWCQPESAV